jgi:hypothetical protein
LSEGFRNLISLLDVQSSCRNAYLEDLTKLGDKYKKKDWGWLWSEAVAQPDLEQECISPDRVSRSSRKEKFQISFFL